MTDQIPQDEQNSRDAESSLLVQRFVEQCKGNDSRTMVRDSLPFLDPKTLSREQVFAIGKAIHRVFGGADSGFLVWTAWAKGDPESFEGEIQLSARWQDFGKVKDDVYQEVREHDDNLHQFLKGLEVQGFNLAEVIQEGVWAMNQRKASGSVPDDMAERFFSNICVNQGKAIAYWFRRAHLAEEALKPFDRMYTTIIDQVPDVETKGAVDLDLDDLLFEHCKTAHVVLAEMRKNPMVNIEDYARDERQRKFFKFALRTWGDVAAGLEQRAIRGLEEQLELTDAVRVKFITESDSGPNNTTADISPKGRCKYLRDLVKQLVKHITRKPADDPAREIGGVLLTTIATAEVLGLSAATCEKNEFIRVQAKPKKELQDRHNAKPC